MADIFDGRLEEYKALRSKAAEMVKRLDDLERNAIVACSAIFVFGISNYTWSNTISKSVIFFLPFVVACFGAVKYLGQAGYLSELNRYVAHIEPEIMGRSGWLTAYYSLPGATLLEPPIKGEEHFKWYRIVTWLALLGLTLTLGILLAIYWQPPRK